MRNLKELAFEHIGLSRNHDNAQIRRALSKAISELETIGFVVPEKRRYRRVSGKRSEWEVSFTLAGSLPKPKARAKRVIGGHTPAEPSRKGPRQPDKVDRYLDSLSAMELRQLEDQAMGEASGFLLETLETEEPNGPLAQECRRQILRAFVTNTVSKRSGKA